jgi:hypothetical protein
VSFSLIVTESESNVEHVLVDVNLGIERKIGVQCYPDWKEDDKEVKEFLSARPGYTD